MAVEWLSYAEASKRLGISPEAVRQKAIRHHWPRRPMNDGRASVQIDIEEVKASAHPRHDRASDDRPTPKQTPVEQPADTRTLDALEAHIVTLREMVAKAEETAVHERQRADSERERANAEAERANGERERADEAHTRADRIASELKDLAERMAAAADDAGGRERSLRDQLDELKAEIAARASRPWWKRLAG